MKAVYVIIGVGIIFIMLGAILTGVNNFISKDQVDPYIVATGGGVTTYDATLSQSLFNNDTALASVSSNISTLDAPIASTYTAATKVLHITGLAASQTRMLTVTYKIDALTYFPAAGTFGKFGVGFIVMGAIGVAIAAVVHAAKGD